MTRLVLLSLVLLLGAAACVGERRGQTTATGSEGRTPSATPTTAEATEAATAEVEVAEDFGSPPPVPDGPLDADTTALIDRALGTPPEYDEEAVRALAETDDARVLWIISDMLRFVSNPMQQQALAFTAQTVGGFELPENDFVWGPVTDHLLAWDLPAYPGYVDHKARLFTSIEPSWQPFFADTESEIDWRQVSWGGVFIDDRPFGDDRPCPGGCIPGLDEPPLVPIPEGAYYPDNGIVFGVIIGDGPARDVVALPRNIMEVHEMINTTLGGRQVAIPYCTLCGAAQVYFTDTDGGGTGEIVMRTSGLLRRSNKVMYDLTTQSVFDTFTGEAVSGPLREADVVLSQAPVVTTTWGEWKAEHPDTLILAGDGGIGRDYPLDPLRGRDDNGPIFPIGDVDPRLPVQEHVLGVETDDGTFLAFPVAAALEALEAGEAVTLEGVELAPDAGGLIATVDGEQVAAHQAFWFAWSQFHPDTLLWPTDVER